MKKIVLTEDDKKTLNSFLLKIGYAEEGYKEACKLLKESKKDLWLRIYDIYPQLKNTSAKLSKHDIEYENCFQGRSSQ